MGGILGASSAIGARMVMRQPLYARIHAFALQVTAGYWAGYQWNKWCSKKNMSEYKHAVDFAQRHSVIQIRSHVGVRGVTENITQSQLTQSILMGA